MSILHEKSPKHCAAKQGLNLHNFHKKFFFLLSTLLVLLLSLALVVWFIIRPTKPQFLLRQTDVLQLDYLSSSPHLLNSSIELTLYSKNPNPKVGIYYDDFQLYASYKGQQITVYSSVPPFYQGHKEATILTASLVGSDGPEKIDLQFERPKSSRFVKSNSIDEDDPQSREISVLVAFVEKPKFDYGGEKRGELRWSKADREIMAERRENGAAA